MRHSAELETAYMSSPLAVRNCASLKAIRQSALAFDHFLSYRGIGRCPFSEDYPEPEPGWQSERAGDGDPELQARRLLGRFLGPSDYVTPYPRAFLAQLEYAREVRAILVAPEKYEIVELCTSPERPVNILGFDIGYWGGGNYSILCDAAIWPVWHPPVSEAVCELSAFINKLNDSALFPSEESAREYLGWYRCQEWAESNPEDFAIIAVGAIEEER
jgi:hypothetical protein